MKRWLIAFVGAAAMAFSVGAAAQNTGFYAGLDIGTADFGNEDDTAFRLSGGFQFHRHIAAEVGVARLFDKGGVEVTALEVAAVGSLPLANQFSVFARIGIANIDIETGAGSRDKTELLLGIGAQYDFTRNLGLRVQWQRYESEPEVDLLSVGAVWRF